MNIAPAPVVWHWYAVACKTFDKERSKFANSSAGGEGKGGSVKDELGSLFKGWSLAEVRAGAVYSIKHVVRLHGSDKAVWRDLPEEFRPAEEHDAPAVPPDGEKDAVNPSTHERKGRGRPGEGTDGPLHDTGAGTSAGRGRKKGPGDGAGPSGAPSPSSRNPRRRSRRKAKVPASDRPTNKRTLSVLDSDVIDLTGGEGGRHEGDRPPKMIKTHWPDLTSPETLSTTDKMQMIKSLVALQCLSTPQMTPADLQEYIDLQLRLQGMPALGMVLAREELLKVASLVRAPHETALVL